MGVCSGELFWETAEAGARRWVLVVHGPPGAAAPRPPGSLDPASGHHQPIAGAHPARVPRGERPLARERDAGGGSVQGLNIAKLSYAATC